MRAAILALVAIMVAGCASQNSKMEKAVIAAQFQPQKGTPEVAARLAEYPPYTFLAIKSPGKKERYAFASPARKTIYVGDAAALKRYGAYIAMQQHAERLKAERTRQGLENFGRGFAAGLAGGAAAVAAANANRYQQTYYAPPPAFPHVSSPTTTQRGSSGSTVQKIGSTYYGSDGSTVQKIGNTYYGSDGSTVQKIGNTYYGSDGSTVQKIGNTYYGSDGSTSQRIGNTIYNQ